MAFIAMVKQSATTLFTKMNGLPPKRSTPKGSLLPPRRGRGRLCGHGRFS